MTQPILRTASDYERLDENFMSMFSITSTVDETGMMYPAFLSQVADVFKLRQSLGNHIKDGIEYSDCFTGAEAVDTLCLMLQTTDRQLALLVGRSLGSQGFIQDIFKTHRLRDNASELYRYSLERSLEVTNGVFTILSECYSPTCTRGQNCYSITCPKRFDRGSGRRSVRSSRQSSNDTSSREQQIVKASDWTETVPKSLLDSLTKQEISRQNAIFELIETEREFVQDLENTYRLFVEPLLTQDIIEESRRKKFVEDVFSNVLQLHTINAKLLRRLIARQQENPIVDKIGDIFVNISNDFHPYILYGGKQVFAKYIVDEEKERNSEFLKFLKTRERLPELRKLALETFLNRPTTRMGRYLLLLKPTMEKAPDGHPDKLLVPQALASIRDVLANINVEVGKADNRLKLFTLEKKISGSEEERAFLKLLDDSRQMIREGKLFMRRPAADLEVQIYLLDHALVVCRKRDSNFRIIRKPIPLELLIIKEEKLVRVEEVPAVRGTTIASETGSQTNSKNQKTSVNGQTANTFPMVVTHLGRQGGSFVLYANSESGRETWMEAIDKQKEKLMLSKSKFEITSLVNDFFLHTDRVNNCAVYQSKLLVAADSGLYVAHEETEGELINMTVTKILEIEHVMQVDVMPNYDLLLILADRNFLTFPLSILESADGQTRKGKKIAASVSFFKQGICIDRSFVCAVKSSTLTATIKVLEPVGLGVTNLRGKLGKLFKAPNEPLRVFKEFYIPTESRSIHFLKTKLCVGCAKGFEIVDLDTLNTQGLLDPSDGNLDFVLKKDTVKPIAIFRVNEGDFLLCYNECGFYVDKYGRLSRNNWIVNWSGTPNSFAYLHPYIIAFDPSFIEIRHADTGDIQQIIPGLHVRTLNTDSNHIDLVMDSQLQEYQHIVRLKLAESY
ncbi:CNH domain-containing protein [Gorgonomyces haynaldii]|nr:CNH domain-containing protein [Gorgonomyces haynaldii]